ncbi:hybrid sensor histidine kinase/response regulator [Aurantibacillus circumpalustris]|uniref:hybrid sensor histidine kinase/response regulator n=1 Tax=Aurantibacillus circumpalustris TaxID=3036359 RepID=UPI00295C253B|nr:ATP-binding protein [Aurantibacillus circumpalustris]
MLDNLNINKNKQRDLKYPIELLDLMSKYLNSDETSFSLQSICDDACFLSKASNAYIALKETVTNNLRTVVSSQNPLKKQIPFSSDLLDKIWKSNNFNTKSSCECQLTSFVFNTEFKDLDFPDITLSYINIYRETTYFGTILFLTEAKEEIHFKESLEYFITTIQRKIIHFRVNKLPEYLFKNAGIGPQKDSDFIFIIDKDFIVNDSNTSTIPGSRKKIIGESILNLVSNNLRNVFSTSVFKTFQSGLIEYHEMPLGSGNFNDPFYSIKFIPITVNKSIETICIIATDTEQPKHLLQDFVTLQQVAKIGWWELFMPSNKLIWSEGLYNILEISYAELEASDDLYVTYIHPEDKALVDYTFKTAIKDNTNYEITYRLIMTDGRIKWVLDKCISYFDDQRNQFRSLGIIQDITQLKNAEVKLEKVNNSFKRLTEQLPGIIFEYQIFENGERRFNSVSEKMVKRSGLSEKILKNDGSSIWDRIHPDDLERMKAVFAESAKTMKKVDVDYRLRFVGNDDQVSWKRLEAKPELQQDKSRIWYGYISDIDEIKEAQIEILKAKEEAERANKAKTEFLANMSHEIRTPLNAVLGFSELLKGNTKGAKYENYIDGILSGGKNLLSLIDDILDLSKIEAGQMNIQNLPLNIKKLANEFRQLFAQKAQEKDINYTIHFENELPKYVLLDETRIRQVLFNLIGNALKFTHEGSVTLSIATESTSDRSKVSLIFKIRDTGIGIPENQHELIFESFKQQNGQSNRKYGGTGLGLAITKRLVDMMNGFITIESKVNGGSCFSVIINDIDVASMEEEQIQTTEDLHYLFQGQKILLVEDVGSNREIIKGFLEPLNLEIEIAENGEEALNILKQRAPDLILMDMMMPVMDGYTATKIIRGKTNYQNIPIIALTASALKQNEKQIRELCSDYLRKPVSKTDLLAILSKYLAHTIIGSNNQLWMSLSQNQNILSGISSKIKQDLSSQFLQTWIDIQKLMSIDDIIVFAKNLNGYASNTNCKELQIYSQALLKYAENFDIEKMNGTFYTFKTFMT